MCLRHGGAGEETRSFRCCVIWQMSGPTAKIHGRWLRPVEQLIAAAKHNRHGHRDATMLLIAYRHGLRAAELVDLRWEQIDFAAAMLHVRRVKRGTLATHPISGDELRALAASSASRIRLSSPRSVTRRSIRQALPASSSAPGAGGQARLQGAPTRYATPAAMRSPIRATTRASCRPTSGTSRYSTPFAVPS